MAVPGCSDQEEKEKRVLAAIEKKYDTAHFRVNTG